MSSLRLRCPLENLAPVGTSTNVNVSATARHWGAMRLRYSYTSESFISLGFTGNDGSSER